MKVVRKCKKIIRGFMETIYLKKLRKRLTNKDFTIVCNNCVGGVIYHNLGLQFLSPTVNLFINGDEYIEFVKNFKYYSSCDVIECHDEDKDYPVGVLVPNDEMHIPIKLFFQHYKTFDEAKRKWVERYARVNYDNIFFIWEFYDTICDKKLMYEFDQLELENKLLITHRQFEGLKNAFAVSCYTDDKPTARILAYKGLSGKRFLEELDYVGFLNDNKHR